MKIEANDKEIRDIFSLGYFKIPRFQRPYSWNIEEVESLWNDVINEQSNNYFIGSMVVYQIQKPHYGIVDGQQRLTTITLILSAIRNAFSLINEEDLAKGVHQFVEKANIDNKDEFILNPESSFPYLQSHIQSFKGLDIDCKAGVEEKKLEAAFELITSKILQEIPEAISKKTKQGELFPEDHEKSVKKLKEIRDKILSLKLVFIQLDNEEDAYLIFETLNARGRDLAVSDLVKNLLLKNIKSTNTSFDQSKEAWNSVIKNFDNHRNQNTADYFLTHFWCSTANHCTKKKLFSEVKKYIEEQKSTSQQILEKLRISAPNYAAITKPEGATWTKEETEIKRIFETINAFKVKQQTSFTLALINSYKEKNKGLTLKILKNTLKKIELFHYCFNAITSQRSSDSIATNYSKLAIKLTNSKNHDEVQSTIHELKNFLSKNLPEKEEFIIKFSDLNYSTSDKKDKAVIKYSLLLLTPTQHSGLTIDTESLTIEHLLSQCNLKHQQSNDIGNIGNLVLIDKKINSDELGNKDPIEKIKILKNSNYPLDESLNNSKIWNSQTIRQRNKVMAEAIYRKILEEIKK